MSATNWEDIYRVQTARIAELEREKAKLREALEAIIKSTVNYDACGYGCDSCDYCRDVPGIAKAALGVERKEAQP